MRLALINGGGLPRTSSRPSLSSAGDNEPDFLGQELSGQHPGQLSGGIAHVTVANHVGIETPGTPADRSSGMSNEGMESAGHPSASHGSH